MGCCGVIRTYSVATHILVYICIPCLDLNMERNTVDLQFGVLFISGLLNKIPGPATQVGLCCSKFA